MKRLLPLLLLLAGCTAETPMTSRIMVTGEGGKYNHLRCDQLEGSMKATQARIDQLVGLMNKAGQSSAGSVIGTTVYGAPLTEARGHLQNMREAYAAKNCQPGVPGR